MKDLAAITELITSVTAGNKRAVTRLISIAEDDPAARLYIAQKLYASTGKAYVIGITGTPGSGKSTLVDKLVKLLRSQNCRVGVIAVDPSSPFSGGAILGDRVRMGDLALDEEVLIRSFGSRGHLGGLSAAVASTVQIMDAWHCDYVLIETVGVGQSEVEIAQMADTTLVISVPGLGDDVQLMKAGILEIGDIMVVNKADREGAQQLAAALGAMQHLCAGEPVPVLLVSAQENRGVSELLKEILAHRQQIHKNLRFQHMRKQRIREEVVNLLKEEICKQVFANYGLAHELEERLDEFETRQANPYDWVVEKIQQWQSRGV